MSRGSKAEKREKALEKRFRQDRLTLLRTPEFRRFLMWLRINTCWDTASMSVNSGSEQNQRSGRRDVWIAVRESLLPIDPRAVNQAEAEYLEEQIEPLREEQAALEAQENDDG